MNIEHYCYNKYIKQDYIVYDIGAHIGTTSILFSNSGAKKVYAFEPSIFNIEELTSNTKKYSNIEIINVALHEKESECITKFRDCKINCEQDREQPIKYATLQKIILEKNIEMPDFIKMDIEGMESLVLKSFDFLFNGCRPIIFVEIHVAPKNEPQSYTSCPHWKTPEEGGFDFNKLKKYNYKIIDKTLQYFNLNNDWNPKPVLHAGFILIPEEKI